MQRIWLNVHEYSFRLSISDIDIYNIVDWMRKIFQTVNNNLKLGSHHDYDSFEKGKAIKLLLKLQSLIPQLVGFKALVQTFPSLVRIMYTCIYFENNYFIKCFRDLKLRRKVFHRPWVVFHVFMFFIPFHFKAQFFLETCQLCRETNDF